MMFKFCSAGDLGTLHAILSFSIGAFVPFLLLKYYNKPDASPFDDNAAVISAFFIATLTYVAAMATELKLRLEGGDCPNIITSIARLSAPFASILLVSIPFPCLGLFLMVIWCGFLVKLALVDSYRELSETKLVRDAAGCMSYLIRIKILRREVDKEEINEDHASATVDSIV
ncbi:hypothetical protein V6N12_054440 [Hibiscus sabdariffa]|uniref:Uncharacterized protein n=1 Tax=Hibiscus sabdariffa TaxID=183260 RepID=A0ABR2D1A7_9ROSI